MNEREKQKFREKIDGFDQSKVDSYRWTISYSKRYKKEEKIFLGHLLDKREEQLANSVEVMR